MTANEADDSYLTGHVLPPWIRWLWSMATMDYKIGFYSVQVLGEWGENNDN